jgi:competence protein ComEC
LSGHQQPEFTVVRIQYKKNVARSYCCWLQRRRPLGEAAMRAHPESLVAEPNSSGPLALASPLMRTHRRLLRSRFRAAFKAMFAFAAIILPLSSASAQQAVIERHVTVRQQPDRNSSIVSYGTPGEAITLLDSGSLDHGYYHVRLGDGRSGWVYRTFVQQSGNGVVAGTTAAASTDVANVYFINVDQANSALMEFPCGAVLIDAGARDQAGIDHLTAFLETFFARRTDLNRHLAAVFITHTHVDHNFALKDVAQRFHVDHYVHNGYLTGSGSANAHWMANYAKTQTPQIPSEAVDESGVGPNGRTDANIDPVNCPRVDPDIRILSGSYASNPGWTAVDFKNQNNHSLVIKVTYGSSRFLFTGDLEKPGIETLLSHPPIKPLLASDVWLAGHHGSDNGTTPELLSAIKPQVVVFSSGDPSIHVQWTAWAYGHPRRSVVTMIDTTVQRGRTPAKDVLVADAVKTFTYYHLTHALYDTAWDGDVHVIARPDGTITVEGSN